VHAPDADLIQLVNFDNSQAGGFPRLVQLAIERAQPVEGTHLKVADLFSLVAMKLYSGGAKSKLDVVEFLNRNPIVDMAALGKFGRALSLGDELESVLELAEYQ
jgi:hypothetical protein